MTCKLKDIECDFVKHHIYKHKNYTMRNKNHRNEKQGIHDLK